MAEEFTRYDTAEFLKSDEEMMLYLDACLEDGDPALTAYALGVIACARHEPLGAGNRVPREGLDHA
ncbi:MAG: hypothetical protein HQM03_14640 [Magnetococcales bacterium]|nr:hypothetical protein [Magnetococcales bacterium]